MKRSGVKHSKLNLASGLAVDVGLTMVVGKAVGDEGVTLGEVGANHNMVGVATGNTTTGFPRRGLTSLTQAYQRLIRERVARRKIQANTSSTAPTLSVLTGPSVPVSQIQHPEALTALDTAPTIPGTTSTSVTSAPARSVSIAMATPSQPIRGSTSASSMDSGPNTLLRQLMSNASSLIPPTSSHDQDTVTTEFHGGKYQIRLINSVYRFTQHEATHVHQGALVDSGANGGMAGSDTRVFAVTPHAFVDITGVGGEMLWQLPIVQCASVVETVDEGPIVLIMSQYAHKPDSKSIHSKSQVEHFGGIVHDSS